MKGVPVGEAEQVKGKTAVLRCDLLLAAALNFIVLTSIAIGLYPGSNNINSHTHGYSFTTNFFSDLGATRVYSHHLNVASAVLFMLALAGVGLAIVFFSPDVSVVAGKEQRLRKAGTAGAACGVISGIAFIGIAAVPWNVSDGLHQLFVQLAFGFLLLFVVFLTAVQVTNHWPVGCLVPNIAYLLLLAAYVVLLFFGPGIDRLGGLEVQAIGQKIIVYSSIANVSIQAYGMRRYLVRTPDMGGTVEAGAD